MGFHPGDSLSIRVDCRNGVARLALQGELDLATVPMLEQHLMLVEQDGVRAVLLDVRDLTFVDCMGLHTFVKAKSRAADNGFRFALVGAKDQLRRILQVTATQGVLGEQEGLRLLAVFTQTSPRTSVGAAWSSDG
jgi:anti-sigma B factor antagonist